MLRESARRFAHILESGGDVARDEARADHADSDAQDQGGNWEQKGDNVSPHVASHIAEACRR